MNPLKQHSRYTLLDTQLWGGGLVSQNKWPLFYQTNVSRINFYEWGLTTAVLLAGFLWGQRSGEEGLPPRRNATQRNSPWTRCYAQPLTSDWLPSTTSHPLHLSRARMGASHPRWEPRGNALGQVKQHAAAAAAGGAAAAASWGGRRLCFQLANAEISPNVPESQRTAVRSWRGRRMELRITSSSGWNSACPFSLSSNLPTFWLFYILRPLPRNSNKIGLIIWSEVVGVHFCCA